MKDDEALLTAWQGGDQRAGNRLFQRHFEPIRRFFINKIDNDDEAADLVQRTFLGCVKAKERFEGRSTFRTFLFAVAHNVLREHYRARRRPKNNAEDIDECSVVDLGAGPTTMVDAVREQRALLLALRRIPLRFQIVLELYFWERLTGAEIGEVLGVPEDTARSRIRRGKELLKKAVETVAKSSDEAKSAVGNLEDWVEEIRAGMG
ncbi:MAG: sigma-70 family RNA polymerase sigma factor [Myxococcota bacterium]